jgi:nucleoside phosphorylase
MRDVEYYLSQLQACVHRERRRAPSSLGEAGETRIEEQKQTQEPKREPARSSFGGDFEHASAMAETKNTVDPSGMPGRAGIVFVAALPEEFDAIREALGSTWSAVLQDGVLFRVAEVDFGGTKVRCAAAVQKSMGMVSAAILVTKAIRSWEPDIVVMTGVCAGVAEKVKLGDIIVAKQVIDYGSGKLQGGRLYPDYEPLLINEQLGECVQAACADQEMLQEVRAAWGKNAGRPRTELSAHLGAIASGAAVVADEGVVVGVIEHKRSLLGIDMEAYGVARACVAALSEPRFLVVKGVQDYADEKKNDKYRRYAAFVCADFAVRVLRQYWKAIARTPFNES